MAKRRVSPPPSARKSSTPKSSQFSRLWLIIPVLCGLYFVHLNGVHIHSLLDFASKPPSVIDTSTPPDIQEQSPQAGFQHTTHHSSDLHSFTRHIVAVGDLHGDYPNALKVLKFSGIVDDAGNWIANTTILVQTGDIIDRGDDTIRLFDWMEQLREQALAAGGLFLSHLGNHEVMNAIGDWRYVYPSELKTFETIEQRQQMISTGRIGRAWASNYTITSRLPLHPYLGPPNTPYPPHSGLSHAHRQDLESGPLSHAALSFVHGGLSPTYEGLVPFPENINEIGSSLLRKLQHREQPPPYPMHPKYPGLPKDATEEEHELYESNGPLWYRGWANLPAHKVCVDVEKVLEKTGTRRMIMGHTPDFHNIVSRCNGKIIIIDTGISHAYGGVLSALSIDYTFTPIIDPEYTGANQKWHEREEVKALYASHTETIADDKRVIVGQFVV